jgi:hypothetical protein
VFNPLISEAFFFTLANKEPVVVALVLALSVLLPTAASRSSKRPSAAVSTASKAAMRPKAVSLVLSSFLLPT